jgi:hypothetical protein
MHHIFTVLGERGGGSTHLIGAQLFAPATVCDQKYAGFGLAGGIKFPVSRASRDLYNSRGGLPGPSDLAVSTQLWYTTKLSPSFNFPRTAKTHFLKRILMSALGCEHPSSTDLDPRETETSSNGKSAKDRYTSYNLSWKPNI